MWPKIERIFFIGVPVLLDILVAVHRVVVEVESCRRAMTLLSEVRTRVDLHQGAVIVHAQLVEGGNHCIELADRIPASD